MPGGMLTVNAPQVVHETIDGETIVIHMATGAYYSFDGVGAEVWQLLLDGASVDGIAPALAGRYEAPGTELDETIASFVEQLLQEGLLTAAAGDAASEPAPPGANGSKAPFAAPVLHKYTDMQEFMLVDPLHDVEVEAGWPHVKAG